MYIFGGVTFFNSQCGAPDEVRAGFSTRYNRVLRRRVLTRLGPQGVNELIDFGICSVGFGNKTATHSAIF